MENSLIQNILNRVTFSCIYSYKNVLFIFFTIIILSSCIATKTSQILEGDYDKRKIDKLQVVDCLLPGQMRQLGASMAYLSARRPIRTSAQDCEIRGGEYIAFDRASYETALAVWLPKALEGDAEAQINVGEIYEKGLGIAPDFTKAATWYRKAAEQGNSQAQINLGYLYEKGLGVEQNLISALNWYRKASGLDKDELIFSSSVEISNQDVTELRHQLSQSLSESIHFKQEAAALKNKLSEIQQQLDNTREQLKFQKEDLNQKYQDIDDVRNQLRKKLQQVEKEAPHKQAILDEISKLESTLKEKELALTLNQKTIAELEKKADEQRKALISLEKANDKITHESKTLKQELESNKTESSRLQSELGHALTELSLLHQLASEKDKSLKNLEDKLTTLQQEVRVKKNITATEQDNNELIKLSTTLKDLELAFQSQQRELEQLNKDRNTLIKQEQEKQNLLDQKNMQIEKLQELISQHVSDKSEQIYSTNREKLAGPTIEIIEPPLIAQRGSLTIRTRSGADKRTLVGKVIAPAGLISLIVNDKEEPVDQGGFFKLNIPVVSQPIPIEIVAVDRNSKRAEMKVTIDSLPMDIQSANLTSKSEAPLNQEDDLRSILPRPLFGKYYALLIGNNHYAKLPKLTTAVNDVQSVAEILKVKYGFETNILVNANRYEILKALNDYRKILTDKDNFLIYYAGHGILDEINDRGHWLPVDAEPDNFANWISVQNITDQLKIMEAKHALVVADSCYSGSLTRSSVARLETGMTSEKRVNWIKSLLNARSRLALSSGGLEPVLDIGGGKHSVFAKAFIDTLSKNNSIIESYAIYLNVSALVADAAKEYDFKQIPEYAPIRHAGHGAGEFFFYPNKFNN